MRWHKVPGVHGMQAGFAGQSGFACSWSGLGFLNRMLPGIPREAAQEQRVWKLSCLVPGGVVLVVEVRTEEVTLL